MGYLQYVGDPLNDTDKKYLEFMFQVGIFFPRPAGATHRHPLPVPSAQGADREGDGRVNFTEFMQHIEKLEEDLLRHAEDAPPTARRRRASIALLGEVGSCALDHARELGSRLLYGARVEVRVASH